VGEPGLKTSEDVDDFALRLNTLQQKLVQFSDDTYDEERDVEKLFRCIPALTSMEERLKLSHDRTTDEVDATQYRRLLWSLRYLAHTRPDLAFSVGYVSWFMQRTTTEHQQAVRRIICYVAGTPDHGIYYPRCPGEAHLVGYSDNDHAGDIDTSKSTSEILFFFGKCLAS
jgi:hypothetical protein